MLFLSLYSRILLHFWASFGLPLLLSTVSTLKPETQQESIDDLSSAEDDNSDKSSTDDSSVGDNLYKLTGNGDNVSDDEMLMTDVEDVFYIDFDDDSGKIREHGTSFTRYKTSFQNPNVPQVT